MPTRHQGEHNAGGIQKTCDTKKDDEKKEGDEKKQKKRKKPLCG
jgi:hypothetical protein